MNGTTTWTDATNDASVDALRNGNTSVLVWKWNQPRNETLEVDGDR
jgi:hypothetical protein